MSEDEMMSLNKHYLDKTYREDLRGKYEAATPCKGEDYELYTNPFKVLKLCHVFQKRPPFKQEILQLKFKRKNNDLYSFAQSEDLNEVDSPVQKYIAVLKNEIGPLLSEVFNVEFTDKLSATASWYSTGDVLLCHDDKCEDRCVAFVLYLTGTGTEDGGSFDMFDRDEHDQPRDIVQSIPPTANSLLAFEVGDFTYHQVSEVKEEHFQRLSINGWFHSKRKLKDLDYVEPFPPLQSQISTDTCTFHFICKKYCAPAIRMEIREKFEAESHVLLSGFFLWDFFSSCEMVLSEGKFNWTRVGPANRRNYSVINNVEVEGGPLKFMVDLIRSPTFISYLAGITGLTLLPLTDEEENPTQLTFEIQKWTSGSYTMATDNDAFFTRPGLDMYIFLNCGDMKDFECTGGTVNYLSMDDEDDESDNELLNIEPMNNALILVYRTSDTIRFFKYINHNVPREFYCICCTYYSGDE